MVERVQITIDLTNITKIFIGISIYLNKTVFTLTRKIYE